MNSPLINITPKLSIIIPFRDDCSSPWLMDRLKELLSEFQTQPELELIVVDSGSEPQNAAICKSLCDEHNVNYVFHDSVGKTFSIGEARDFGVCNASGKAVTFLDVDLRVSNDFWGRLFVLMEAAEISQVKQKFIAIPCIYLTPEGSEVLENTSTPSIYQSLYLSWLRGEQHLVENMAPCSSVMIVDRLHYMSVGGHRPEFRGHGYEDFELYHRLMAEEGSIPRARNYYRDAKNWKSACFQGFRSQLALLGKAAASQGLYVVHLWHPRPKASSHYKSMNTNRSIWVDLFKQFDASNDHPEPLIDMKVKSENTLIFGEPKTSPMRSVRDILPLLGNPIYINEQTFVDEEGRFLESNFERYIEYHSISRVFFTNPYGNEARTSAYKWVRDTKIPFYCFDRGALPDSWFFDNNGFNADSSSYLKQRWQRVLKPCEKQSVKDYINYCISGADTLEQQGIRQGGEALREQLKLRGKKVLFVPLQRPSDSVIKHFLGSLTSYEEFVTLIDKIANELSRFGWVVLCKKHPLESESPELKHATYVEAGTHFIDLLELADSVALINSGVGVYAAMMLKPCFIFGSAFYEFEGINQKIENHTPEHAAAKIITSMTVEEELVYQFIHHLQKNVYSYGISKTKIVKTEDDSSRSITTSIDFYQINLPGKNAVRYSKTEKSKVPQNAPLFEKYQLDIHQYNKNNSKARGKNQLVSKTRIHHQQSLERRSRKDAFAAKKSKFQRDPRSFFRDAKLPLLRPLMFLFPASG